MSARWSNQPRPEVQPPPAVASIIGPLVVRRWAASMGTTPRRLVVAVAAAVLTAALVGLRAAAVWTRAGGDDPLVGGAAALLLAVTLTVFFGAAAFTIFAERSRSLPRSLAVLHSLPVSAEEIRRAGALPVVALGCGLGAAVVPGAVVFTARLSGRGPVLATAILGLVVVGGAAAGRLLWSAAERVVATPSAASLRLTAAYLGWTVLLGLSLVAPSALLRWSERPGALLVLSPLGWPLCWWALVAPGPWALSGAGAVATTLWQTARRLSSESPSAVGTRESFRPGRLRVVAFGRPFPLVRFEMRRLVRNPRSLEAIMVSAYGAGAVVLALVWLGHRTRAVFGASVVGLLAAQVATGFAATGRGLSARRRPTEALLGLTARTHVVGLYAADLGVGAAAAAPGLLVATLGLPPAAAGVWLAALPLTTALALLVSVALTPEPGSGAAEAGAVLAYAALSTVVIGALSALGPSTALASGFAVTVVAVAASIRLEQTHRRAP